MATQSEPSRDGNASAGAATPRPVSASHASRESREPREPWTPPKIVRHGSVRHLVRGVSGFLNDLLGMPGMRKS